MVDPRSGDPEVRFAPDGVLVDRALALLREAPRPSSVIAADVLGIRGGPPALADRLVASLFAGEARVACGTDGLWRITPGRSQGSERGLDLLKYAVVDVETTGGVAAEGGRVIEIAIVHVDRGEVGDSYSTLIDAEVSIPPFISRLTGIRTEMTTGAPRFSEILGEVRERLRGRVFVAHSAGYDWAFLRSEMRRAGAAPPRGPRLCTVHLARRLLPGLERRGLDSVARYYGVEIRDRHRAQGDAIATAQVLLRMLADAQRRGWTTWEELCRALAKAPPKRKRRAIAPPLPHEREPRPEG